MVTINATEESIPSELRPIEHWICWREGERDGKPTKIPTKPYRTNGSPNLDVTDPSQRRDFETAWKSLNDSRVDADGLGFVFTEEVGIAGVDLDKCRNPETGELEEWAAAIVERLDSYTEVSPSGTGVHILVGGELPPGGNRKGRVEMYDTDRYFTVTGEHVEGTPTDIRKCQVELAEVHRDYIRGGIDSEGQMSLDVSAESNESGGREKGGHRDTEPSVRQSANALRERYGDALGSIEDAAVREALERVATKYLPRELPRTFDDLAGPGVELSDEEVLTRMFDSNGGERKRRLYEGDTAMWGSPQADYPSQSEADMALVHNLAFWTGKDPHQMDSLFRGSGLYREKWGRKHYSSGATYGEVAIARALLRVEDYYEPPSRDGKWSSRRSKPSSQPQADGENREGSPDLIDDRQNGAASLPESRNDPARSRTGTGSMSTVRDGDTSASPQRPQGGAGAGGDEDNTSPTERKEAATGAAGDRDNPQENGQRDSKGPPSFNEPEIVSNFDADGDTGKARSTQETPTERRNRDGAPNEATQAPASPSGVDTDEEISESTQRAMEETAAAAGPEWERTDPTLVESEKHPNDWTVPRAGRTPTEQALTLAREDNRILARRLRREAQRIEDYRDVEAERDRLEFTAEVYLRAIDELMGERNRYRNQLRTAGLLSREDEQLPNDPVEYLKQILRPMVRREDTTTAKETLTGLDAILREYEEVNERIQSADREGRGGVRRALSRLFK